MIARFLDERTARIARELEEAKKLREEAQELLAQATQKRRDAGAEAEAIVRQAKSDAEAFAQETRRRFTETMERRSAGAEQKIAQAEAQAVKDVRMAATDLAIGAASRILSGSSIPTQRQDLSENSGVRHRAPEERGDLASNAATKALLDLVRGKSIWCRRVGKGTVCDGRLKSSNGDRMVAQCFSNAGVWQLQHLVIHRYSPRAPPWLP